MQSPHMLEINEKIDNTTNWLLSEEEVIKPSITFNHFDINLLKATSGSMTQITIIKCFKFITLTLASKFKSNVFEASF